MVHKATYAHVYVFFLGVGSCTLSVYLARSKAIGSFKQEFMDMQKDG
jgi:hypothetical protein